MEAAHDSERFERIRSRGPWNFILRFGVVYWGVTTAVLFTIFMSVFSDDLIGRTFLTAMIVFPVGGFFWGAFMWSFMNRRADREARERERSLHGSL